MRLLVGNGWTKQPERPLHCLRNLHLKGTWVKKPMAKARGVLELNTINMLSAKVDALTKMVSKSQVNSLEDTNLVCETYGELHSYSQCNMNANEDINYIQGGFNQRVGLNSNS